MSEKLCLKWNDFQKNVSHAFGSLREDMTFSDVTLACEDGEQVEAHKVILAASSPFFLNFLRKNKHPHPLIYMRGIKSEDLVAIIDFIYFGEANVFQNNIETFLAIADELDLKGLSGSGIPNSKLAQNPEPTSKDQNKATLKEVSPPKQEEVLKHEPQENDVQHSEVVSGKSMNNQSFEFTGQIEELDEMVKSLMTKSQNKIAMGREMAFASVCTVCGKEGQFGQVKNHIEANHLEGVSIPCSLCEKTFRSRTSLGKHYSRNH